MKNTKRLLMILCAAAMLFAMVFSIGVSAATGDEIVVSGKTTSISEYFDMKKITEYGFEDEGRLNTLFGNRINNGGVGGVYNVNNIWKSTSPVYGDEISKYFFAIDYGQNSSGADVYIQPVLAEPPGTANIEKSPQYGFVAEFDIAFFSPVENVTEPYVHETLGSAYEDYAGTVIYKNSEAKYIDENGRLAYRDSTGKTVFASGTSFVWAHATGDRTVYIVKDGGRVVYLNDNGALFDSNNDRIADVTVDLCRLATLEDMVQVTESDVKVHEVPVMIPMLDEKGNEVKENGETVMVEQVKKTSATFENIFEILMLNNASTVQYGAVTALKINANNSTGKVTMGSYTANTDEWIHISIQYDADTLLTYIYAGKDDTVHSDNTVGRKLIAQFNSYDAARGLLVYPVSFRLRSASKGGIVGFDNFLAYQGTSIHNPDLLSGLTPTEQFVYLSGILEDENNDTPAVISYESYEYIKNNFITDYYDTATGTIKPAYIGNAVIESAVATYAKYAKDEGGVMTDLRREINIENRDRYVFYANNALSVSKTLDNVDERNAKITAADKFLSSVGSAIERDAIFLEYQEKLAELKVNTEKDVNAKEFVTHMSLFDASVKYGASLNRINNHYQNAKSYYDKGISHYSEFVYQTSAGEDTQIKKSHDNLKKAIDIYLGTGGSSAAEIVASTTRKNNSGKFIGIIGTMQNESCGNWANDSQTVENLWKMALDILLDNNYDAEVAGMKDALAIFNSANDFFWKKLQNDHKAILKERLERFNTSASYVDKAAICTFVERYIELNARYIDMDDVELKGFVVTTEAYKAQLGTVEEDYAKILVQNTIAFVNTMKYADMYDSYADLKVLYDEATNLYYAMNFKSDSVSEEEINLYVEKYELLRSKVTSIETECTIFINNTKLLSTSNTADKYTALAQCCECLDNLDPTYEGVTEARTIFDSEYSKYSANIKSVNDQIEQTANVSCSLRGNWGFDKIVSYFKSIFN